VRLSPLGWRFRIGPNKGVRVSASAGFAASARSVVGLVRSGNEDSALVHSHLLAIADGMGGHAGGEIASAIAIKTLSSLTSILDGANIDPDSVEDLLLNSLYDVDGEIGRAAHHDSSLSGMGTTLSALMFYRSGAENNVALLHIGDSRCYRLRGNVLLQLSRDHTVQQELLDQGVVSPEEASEHPQRSFLTQAVNGEGSLTPVLMVHNVNPADRFLLCSDGLSGVLSQQKIKIGLKIKDRDEAVTYLIDEVFSAGAPDNVTVIIADIAETNISTDTTFLGAAK
jgi:serine/threonine protein phosphatase PrpC